MKLSFQNFYAFEFTLGLLGIATGLFSLQYSLFFIFLILGSTYFIFDSAKRWNNIQKDKEFLSKLELENKSAGLDFDIKSITAMRDVDWEPDDVINGEPIGFNEYKDLSYKIKLIIYNRSSINNIVRNVSVSVLKNKCNLNFFSPRPVPPRDKIELDLVASLALYYDEKKGKKGSPRMVDKLGKEGDIVNVTIYSMDNKAVSKEKTIDYYELGENLKQTQMH